MTFDDSLAALLKLWKERASDPTYVDRVVETGRLPRSPRPGARKRVAEAVAAGAKITYSEWKPGDEPGIECANCGAPLVVLSNNVLGCPTCQHKEQR